MSDPMSSPTGPHRYAALKALEHEELALAIQADDRRRRRNQQQRERRRKAREASRMNLRALTLGLAISLLLWALILTAIAHAGPDPWPGFTHHFQVQHHSQAFGGYHSPFHSPAHLWEQA